MNQVSRLELAGYMAHMLLRDSDVFSMANGIEIRVPLLDHELVAAVVRLPGLGVDLDEDVIARYRVG